MNATQSRTSHQLRICPKCKTRLVPQPKDWSKLRTEFNLMQRELAEMLGIQGSYVSYLEAGRRYPSGALIERLWKLRAKLEATAVRNAENVLRGVSQRRKKAAA